MSAYVRHNYRVHAYTLTVPAVTNDGLSAPWHLEKVRAGLEEAGFTGWTETATVGYWRGILEPGTVITVYVPVGKTIGVASRLGAIGRQAMPDQDAVQVTASPDELVLVEA